MNRKVLVCLLSLLQLCKGFAVGEGLFPERQESGLIDIEGKGDVFYWLFYSRSETENDPLIIWLSGELKGAGSSSLISVFNNNGPFTLSDGQLKKNPYSWNNKANLLYIDQPSGVGFSKAGKTVRSLDEAAIEFLSFLKRFIQRYPKFQNTSIYLGGSAFAGHLIPAIAYQMQRDQEALIEAKITLKGAILGSAWVDPKNQYNGFPQFSYDAELTGVTGKAIIEVACWLCSKLIEKNWQIIDKYVCDFAVGIAPGDPEDSYNYNLYDIRKKCDGRDLCYDFKETADFLNRADVKQALGVEDRKWQEYSPSTHEALLLESYRGVTEKVTMMLDSDLDMLFYYGDKDYMYNWWGAAIWLNHLQWKHSKQFQKTESIENDTGTVQSFANLTFYRVYDSGQLVGMDQPEKALKMINSFIHKNN